MPQSEFSLSRRGFLGGLAAAGSVALLTACGTSPGAAPSSGGGQVSSGARLQLPTYMPAQGPAPDVPGNAQGVEPGYVTFPKQLSKTVQQVPANGGDITGVVLANVNGVPVAAES